MLERDKVFYTRYRIVHFIEDDRDPRTVPSAQQPWLPGKALTHTTSHCAFLKYTGEPRASNLIRSGRLFEKRFVWNPTLLCWSPERRMTDHTGISMNVENRHSVLCLTTRRFFPWKIVKNQNVWDERHLRTEIWLYFLFFILILRSSSLEVGFCFP